MVRDVTASTRKTRKDVLSEWRRAEIIEAARRIFARLGYSESNVEQIASEAGIGKGTVYLYFKSKEEVFAAVLATDLETLTNKAIEGMASKDTLEERLQVFFDVRVDYIRNYRDFLQIYLSEFGSRGSRSPLLAEVIDRKFRRSVESLRECVEQAIARGEIRKVPAEAAAHAILDLAKGFSERQLRGWGHMSIEEDAAFTRSIIVNGLRNT